MAPHGYNPRQRALLLLVLTAVLWSLGGVLIKFLPWNAAAVAGMRAAIAALVLIPLHRGIKADFSLVTWLGALAYSATVLLFVIATKMTSAANAIILQYTGPLFVAILGIWLLKERPHRFDWIAIGLVLIGIVIMFGGDIDTEHLFGNLIALMSGLAFALLAIALRASKDRSPLTSVILGNALTAIVALPFAQGLDAAPSSVVAILALGVLQIAIPYYLYSRAIKEVTALEAVLVPAVEPVLNPVWVMLALGEAPGLWALIGGAIVLATLVGRSVLAVRYLRKG